MNAAERLSLADLRSALGDLSEAAAEVDGCSFTLDDLAPDDEDTDDPGPLATLAYRLTEAAELIENAVALICDQLVERGVADRWELQP